MTLLAIIGNAGQYISHYLPILELHKLEELLAALEGKSVHREGGCSKITEYPPLAINLMYADTFIRIVCAFSPVLRVELFDEWS